MKRTPLQRKTPLRARPGATGGYERPPAPPMDFGAAATALARQRASAEAPREFTGPVVDPVKAARPTETGAFRPVVRQTIIDRDNGRCQSCGRNADADVMGYSMQHRAARQMGGTNEPYKGRASNGILLCGSGVTGCHGFFEAHGNEAERLGFAVASWADPLTVPVLTYAGWRYLCDNGTAWPTIAPPGNDAHEVAKRRTR